MGVRADTYERSLHVASRTDAWSGLVSAAELAARSVGAEAVSLGFVCPGHPDRVTQTVVGFDDALAAQYAELSASDPLPGPAVMRSRTPLYLADRASTIDRFPATRPILDGSRYEAAACLPLTTEDGKPLGYLATHYASAHRFDAEEVAHLRGFAAVCAGTAQRLMVAGGDRFDLLQQEIEGLTTAMRTRSVIEQAKGMLMQRYDLSGEAAWHVLRRLSSESNVKLREVARRLVEGEPVAGLTGRFIGESFPGQHEDQ